MNIAQSKTRDKFPLSEKKITKKTISSVFPLIIFFLVFWGFLELILNAVRVASGQLPVPWLGTLVAVLFIIVIISIVLTYLYQRWYFAVYFYDLTPDFIQIKKGPITPSEITIPYERIQDVYVDQDLLDRMLGLYDVHLSSATASSGMEAHIDGVEKQAAEGLRTALLETVKQRISKNKEATTIQNDTASQIQ